MPYAFTERLHLNSNREYILAVRSLDWDFTLIYNNCVKESHNTIKVIRNGRVSNEKLQGIYHKSGLNIY